MCRITSEHAAAEKALHQVLDIAAADPTADGAAELRLRALNNFGSLYLVCGRLPEAIEKLEEAGKAGVAAHGPDSLKFVGGCCLASRRSHRPFHDTMAWCVGGGMDVGAVSYGPEM